jgi:molecular chaperone DnaK
MKEQIEKINQIAHKLAEAMYAQTQEQPSDGGEPGDSGEAGDTSDTADGDKGEQAKSDDDVVDAEFEDVGKK